MGSRSGTVTVIAPPAVHYRRHSQRDGDADGSERVDGGYALNGPCRGKTTG
jgi:hypothetical protein